MGPAEHQGKEVCASAQRTRREHSLNKQTVRSDRAPVRKKPNNAHTHLPRRSTVPAPAAPTSLRGLPVWGAETSPRHTPLGGQEPWSTTQAAGSPGRTARVLTPARDGRVQDQRQPHPQRPTHGTQAGAGAQACDRRGRTSAGEAAASVPDATRAAGRAHSWAQGCYPARSST